jgi:hypothetical protein
MKKTLFWIAVFWVATLAAGTSLGAHAASPGRESAKRAAGIEQIANVVVIYSENRSFDNLYGSFPGADGLRRATKGMTMQRDRDSSVLNELPPVWGGLTAKGVVPPITEAQTQHLANRPFAIDDSRGFDAPLNVITISPWHLFYQNQMQIAGGRNDKFAAFADTGALVMGHYNTRAAKLPLWRIAQRYTLADGSSWVLSAAPSQSLLAGLRLHAEIPQCRPESGQGRHRRRRGRRGEPEARRRFPAFRDGWRAEIRPRRQSHARLLRGQYDAAALSAERQ